MNLPEPGAAHDATQVALVTLADHSKSEAYRAVRTWLSALAVQQMAYMAECRPDRLSDAQVRLKQLRALVAALDGGGGSGHVFD